jgi:hypothetical protein
VWGGARLCTGGAKKLDRRAQIVNNLDNQIVD